MTLQEARNFFENLRNETSKKSQIKIYDKFIHILTELNTRELSSEELQSIENKLTSFDFTSKLNQGIKFFKKALADFETFLKENFSLILKGYYTNIGMGLGMSFGVLFGLVFLSGFERSMGISLGICLGMFVGLLVGRNMDAKALAEGNVI
ncbi:hypothetical protein [Arcticibacterium luteifluviistationis]|uniref:Glycine zipper family protein n=1 Tax=Arcticibacterium luteifluviistationis TaxID=1784714 RepID=A0A2Z4GBT6_9BACT|nr:hypothetical protein [Arcticibacterium luteifluviistationis]AWV98749.1 hypothetical protein DJ013_11425 [Arcticibacterium luteifluviistationis]